MRNHYQQLAKKLEDIHSSNPTEYLIYWKKHKKNINNTHHIALALSNRNKANITPIRNVYFDYNFMDKLAYLVDQWNQSCELKYDVFHDDIMNSPMTAEELSLATSKAQTCKTRGLDMILVEFYIGQLYKIEYMAYSNLYTKLVISPKFGQIGMINPIYKWGKTCDPENYWKITLLSSFWKLVDFIITNWLCFVKEALEQEN